MSHRLRGTVRLGLFDVFETEQHLVLGQRLRPAAEAVPLQFLDDLAQPVVLNSLGEQHRFQRLGIVRQCVARHAKSDHIRPNFATTCQAPDSLRRRINHQPGCVGVAVSRAS